MSDSVGYNVVVTVLPQAWASLVVPITTPIILATKSKSWSEAAESLESSQDNASGFRTYSDKKGQRTAEFTATTDQTQDFVELSKLLESSSCGSHFCDITYTDYGCDQTHNTEVFHKSGTFVLVSVDSKVDAAGKAEYSFKFSSHGAFTTTGDLSDDLVLDEGT